MYTVDIVFQYENIGLEGFKIHKNVLFGMFRLIRHSLYTDHDSLL